MYEELTAQARQAVTELLEAAKLKPGKIFVVGCSSSEMVGARIGKGSSLEAAQAAFAGIYPVLQAQGIELAVQCCEHLNRALVVERAVAESHGFEIVNAIPQLHAGGSFAMTASRSRRSAPTRDWTSAARSSACTCAGWPSRSGCRSRRSAKPISSAPARARSTSAVPERSIRNYKRIRNARRKFSAGICFACHPAGRGVILAAERK